MTLDSVSRESKPAGIFDRLMIMGGGITDFAPGVDLMFYIEQRDAYRYLGVAALVRRTTSRRAIQPKPSCYMAPPGAIAGGGGNVGSFYLTFYLPQRVLRVDGVDLLTMPADRNVALLEELIDRLELLGTCAVTAQLGARESVRDLIAHGMWTQTLRERLYESPEVRTFLDRQ
jgi:hypothetical protein